MKNLFALAFILLFGSTLSARQLYMTTSGDDNNDGSSMDNAVATLHGVTAIVQPGDTVNIADGKYDHTDEVVFDSLGSDKDNPILVRAMNMWGAHIYSTDKWNAIKVRGTSYITFDGLKVSGCGYAGVHLSNPGGTFNTIRNCYVFDCGGPGIDISSGDYMVVENNVVRGNATRHPWSCSGIVCAGNVASDSNTDGWHIVIRNNLVYNNYYAGPNLTFIANNWGLMPSDGNGIIIDSSDEAPQIFNRKILIENNVVWNNGGKGIHVFKSDNVTIRNNTCYHNSQVLARPYNPDTSGQNYENLGGMASWATPGEMSISETDHCAIYNNIIVRNPDFDYDRVPALEILASYHVGGVKGNIFVGKVKVENTHDANQQNMQQTMVNGNGNIQSQDQNFPKFKAPSREFDAANFEIPANSPAVDAGSSDSYPSHDIRGVERPFGSGVDIGAFEYTTEEVAVAHWGRIGEGKGLSVISTANGLKVSLPTKGNWSIALTDPKGRTVVNKQLKGQEFSVENRNLAAGFYLLDAKGPNADFATMLLIK